MSLIVNENGDKEKESEKRKIKDFFSNIKANWHSSTKPGEFLGFKEIFSYSFTGSGVGGVQSLMSYVGLSAFIILIGSIYQISATVLYFMGSTMTLTGLITTPALSMIMDNSKSSKGKFKPYLIWSSIISMTLLSAIPFIPLGWVDITLFILPGVSEPVSLAAFSIFIMHLLLSWSFPVMTVAYTGLGQRMTPSSIERARVFSYQSLIASLWSSVVGILFPLLAILTKREHETGMESILSYRVFFPIFGVLSIVFILFTYNNIKERIIVEKGYQPKVKFWHGAKSLFTNRYFWIISINAMLTGFRGMNLAVWINVYSLKSEVAVSLTTTLFGNALIPGMLLTGYLVKKVGKRSLMLTSGFLATFTYIPMILFPDRPILLLCLIFLQNLCSGFAACLRIMPADALDWQQLKTGERLEGFWGMFHMMVLSIAGLGLGLLLPWVLRISGMPAGAEVLDNELIRHIVFRNISIASGIANLLATIPFLFWDLTEEKQKIIITQLEEIAQEKDRLRELGEKTS